MSRFRGVFLAIMPYHSSTERQCSDFGADFGTFERICSVFEGHSMVIFMTEWVDSDVLNWVGMLRFRHEYIIRLVSDNQTVDISYQSDWCNIFPFYVIIKDFDDKNFIDFLQGLVSLWGDVP